MDRVGSDYTESARPVEASAVVTAMRRRVNCPMPNKRSFGQDAGKRNASQRPGCDYQLWHSYRLQRSVYRDRHHNERYAGCSRLAKSAEIIKPVLRGRDIQRYQAQWAGLWLVDTHNGYGDIPAIEIDRRQVGRASLTCDDFSTRLTRRGDKGKTHYNHPQLRLSRELQKGKVAMT